MWMLCASFVFALMGVCVKLASAHYNAAEVVFYRGIISSIFTAIWAHSLGISLKTTRPGMHVWRALIGTVSLAAWFYAISKLPLATAITLNYTSSVWVAAFVVGGAILYRPQEKNGWLFATVLAGFAGVVMVLRPAFEANQLWPGLIGLMSGMTAALAYLQVIALSRAGEPEARVVFYFALAAALLGGVGVLIVGVSSWSWQHAVWLIPIGVLASLGQLFMTRAYAMANRTGATLVVANLQFSGIVFGALFSLIIFGDFLPWIAWVGMLVIIASGIAATVLRNRAVPQAPAEEH
jgi:S-adenosylmethionine uptake transporter